MTTKGTFTFRFPHSVIRNFHVSFVTDESIPRKPFKAEFFFDNEARIPNQKKREILQMFVSEHLKLPKVPLAPITTLVVHIRGEDICKKDPHPLYVQPPLSLYTLVINTHTYQNIRIVTTPECANPVIQPLLNMYGSRISTQTADLNTDVATLLHAQHILINSMGSFGRMIMMMSKHIRVCHIPYYRHADMDNPYHDMRSLTATKVYAYECREYIQPGEWRFDATQQERMLTYPSSQIRVMT